MFDIMANVGVACAAAVRLAIPYECIEPVKPLCEAILTNVPSLLESLIDECQYFAPYFMSKHVLNFLPA